VVTRRQAARVPALRNRPIDTIYVSDPRHNDRAPVPFKYPRAGTKNANRHLGLIDASGGEPQWIPWTSRRIRTSSTSSGASALR